MPLPLLPLLLIGSSAATAVKGGYDLLTAGSEMRSLQEKYNEHKAQYEQAENHYHKRRRRFERRLERLGKLRLEALETLREAAEFIDKAKVRDRKLFEDLCISQEQLEEWEGASLRAVDMISGLIKSTGAGVATASSIYGLVGALGVASTGTAISTLSGAAATNATLAWLGGGALAAGGGGMALGSLVLGGLVTGPAFLVGGFFAGRKLEAARTEVAQQLAEMDIAKAQMEHQLAEFKVTGARIDEVGKATRQAQSALHTALQTAKPGVDEDLFIVAKLAMALGNILDVKVLCQVEVKV